MLAGVLDGRQGTNDTLIICDLVVRVQGNIEVDLVDYIFSQGSNVSSCTERWSRRLTRIRTRLPFSSTSVIASLLESDMVSVFPGYFDLEVVRKRTRCFYSIAVVGQSLNLVGHYLAVS